MRNRFDNQLAELNDELISMGALCENAIASAVKALLERRYQAGRLPPSALIRRLTARSAKSSPCASSCCCSSSRLQAICV